jgi:hypothetical protein
VTRNKTPGPIISVSKKNMVANKIPIVYNYYCHDNKKININKKGGFMKSKKFSKKLSLNKKTIAHLTDNEKQAIQGGITPDMCGTLRCPTGSYFLVCCI